ncbi:MAG: CDP-alcohol phosphatidyltransferase family protein [Saprospiraceae bacterium]|nr:CDP-alcohol phosphatidyltransferase family protein [Saprospiraceae bacterium]MCF8252519.1 CDP-alcohol phosphatidyltransferase family protein [Saprospiraceae bacterium]MCF8282543.1 CDP-alcohol phosphatidyltransferase family protein [Bacteroidales bacterium]MCF8314128.1 CDP-alcohol phosphatidyltransferase family protein [Saprospiraceae bacterium]MCF8442873.1 CDP-alcohol phosphatidyltransferase family protein [Saprospiraceae bacterium]
MKKNIPNFITLLNLFFGCCAIASVLYGQFVQAFWFSLASGVADYLDGACARMLKVKSPLGQQLDSLADMVSFGVAPGAVIYMLLVKGLAGHDVLPIQLTLAASPAFLITLFAAIRLAIFNLDTRQTDNFIGMPTPSCAIYAIGLLLIYHFDSFGLGNIVTNPIFLYLNIPVLCLLMVAGLPMFSLKFKNLAWEGNQIRFIFAAFVVVSLVFLREAAFPFIIIGHVLFSFIVHLKDNKKLGIGN